MLLSSSSFSNFLDHLSSNSSTLPQAAVMAAAKSEMAQQPQQQEQRQAPKDLNPYSQQSQQQQIGMAMIPEQNVDFSMLSLGNNGMYSFQPQVFVVDTPEMPAPIDTSLLSGKTSNFVAEAFECGSDKIEVPVIERPVEKVEPTEVANAGPVDEEFEADPEFALFHSEPALTNETAKATDDECAEPSIFGGIESEKMLSRYDLVDATAEEATAALAMARVLRISASIEPIVSRLEMLTMDL